MTLPENAANPIAARAGDPWSLAKKVCSFPAMLGVALVGAFFLSLRGFDVDPSVWWHIKVGATLLSTHRWPTADVYSFTVPGTPWIAYEWLGEIPLAAVERAWGLGGILGLHFALGAAILIALYALATRRCGNSKAAMVACAVHLPLVHMVSSLRPQIFGFLFLVLTLIILERFREGRTGALWLLPPLFAVWVNTHGSFVLGLFVLGVYTASGLVDIHWGGLESRLWTSGERLRLGLVALLSFAALTLTPYGAQLAAYPLDLATAQPLMVANIEEWQPLVFGGFSGKLFLALVLAFVMAQITLRPAWRLEELVLYFAGVVAACLHVRFLLVFVPFSAPLLAVILARGISGYEPDKDKYALNAILMALAVAAMVWLFPSRAQLSSVVEEKWPARAVRYVKQHSVPRPMYNTYGYGGYLIWQSDGQDKVFIDGRADIYERAGVLADYRTISRVGLATPFLLDAYRIQSCLVGRDEALATLLAASPQWQRAYTDELSALYVRVPRTP